MAPSSPSDAAFIRLAAHCPRLEQLYLARTGIGDKGVTALARSCGGLTHLYLGYTKVHDAGVGAAVEGCARLEQLSLVGTDVSDATVELLAKALDAAQPPEIEGRRPSLTFVDLSHNARVGRSGVEQLRRRCGPKVRIDAVRLGPW